MIIVVTSGTGEGPTPLAAFDAALKRAGLADYNLLYLSSVIPPGSVVNRARFVAPSGDYGERLFVVMSREDKAEPGQSAWAGLGWTQVEEDGRGLFVEIHGGDRSQVKADIRKTLESMIEDRPFPFGPIESEIVGIKCDSLPVCAVVAGIYRSEGWGE